MILQQPSREPREQDVDYVYGDSERVQQKDGRVAVFYYRSDFDKVEWKFSHYEDAFGFSEPDENYAKMVLHSIVKPDELNSSKFHWLEKLPIKDMNEYYKLTGGMLVVYYYNEPLATRGGLAVVNQFYTKYFLKIKQYIMG